MTSSGFAIMLVIGIVLFVTGSGGLLTHGFMLVGAVGLVATVFGGRR